MTFEAHSKSSAMTLMNRSDITSSLCSTATVCLPCIIYELQTGKNC